MEEDNKNGKVATKNKVVDIDFKGKYNEVPKKPYLDP